MSSKEEALRRLDNLEKNLVKELEEARGKVEILEEQMGKFMVERDRVLEANKELENKIHRLEEHIEGYRGLKDSLARFLGLAEAKSLADMKNEILDEVKKSLPNLTASSGVEGVEVTKTVPKLEVMQHRPTIKRDDSDPLGRIAILIDDGWWEERHNVKQVVEEFNNRGWSDTERKDIEGVMVEMCRLNFLSRKISTGNIMWYELTKDAKERVKKKVKE